MSLGSSPEINDANWPTFQGGASVEELGVEETKSNLGDDDEYVEDEIYVDTDDDEGEASQDEDDDEDEVEASEDDDEDEVKASEDEDEGEATDGEGEGYVDNVTIQNVNADISEDEYDDESDEYEEDYLEKFDKDTKEHYIADFHPESTSHNDDEVRMFSKVVRDKNGIIIDELHKTLPFLTKYEYTRIIGQREKQLDSGAQPFIKVVSSLSSSEIAKMELEQKKIPFIVRRPMPAGGFEYWKLEDLELLRV